MIEINLIPDVKREYLKARSLRNAVITISTLISIGAAGVVVVLSLVFGGQAIFEASQDGSIDKKSKELSAVEDLSKTVTVQQQLELIDSQHNSKLINSRLFDVMSLIIPPDPNKVTISNLRMDPEEKKITIEGSAANGYLALETFKKKILNTSVQVGDGDQAAKLPLTEQIVPGDSGIGESSDGRQVLSFSFSFIYPGELFARSKDSVSIITPEGRIDVTDSKLGIPSSLFGERVKDIQSGEEGGN